MPPVKTSWTKAIFFNLSRIMPEAKYKIFLFCLSSAAEDEMDDAV